LRFLILDHYYPDFLDRHYKSTISRPEELTFYDHRRLLMGECFGTADFYSRNLLILGHEAQEHVINCRPLQEAWTREWAPKLSSGFSPRTAVWEMKVVDEQVRRFNPDVLFIQNITYFDSEFVSHLGNYSGLVVGQAAYPLDWGYNFGSYDLIISSFPHYVDRFRQAGVNSAYLALAFEESLLQRLGELPTDLGAVFVGGISANHRQAERDLEHLAQKVPLDLWGYGADTLPTTSPLRAGHHGPAWGIEMYKILARSRIALNRHGEVSGNFANNMRLYEATGVGSCLVTDLKDNLKDFFEVDREIVAYESAEDCADKISYLLEHDRERSQIAQAGQRRTLRDHTYSRRIEELVEIVKVGLRNSRSKGRHSPPRAPWKPPRTSLSQSAKEIVRRSPAAPLARWAYGSVKSPKEESAVSVGHHLIDHQEALDQGLPEGWKSVRIPRQQRVIVDEELKNMYRGETIPAYKVAAEALDGTGVKNPHLLEIGCSSAYYSEVLPHLLKSPIRYTGIDISEALLRLAAKSYPGLRLTLADAKCLPFRDSSWEVVFSSGTIMHILDYAPAIEESFRVSAGWCIYHRTPVTTAQTTLMSKLAYGVPVLEFVFNEIELLEHFRSLGADIVRKLQIDTYQFPGLSAPVELNTYTCRKR